MGTQSHGPGAGLSRSLGSRAAEGRIRWTTLCPWGPLRSTQVEPARLIGPPDGIGGDWAALCTGATWTGRRRWPSLTSGGTRRTPPRGRSGARSSVPESNGLTRSGSSAGGSTSPERLGSGSAWPRSLPRAGIWRRPGPFWRILTGWARQVLNLRPPACRGYALRARQHELRCPTPPMSLCVPQRTLLLSLLRSAAFTEHRSIRGVPARTCASTSGRVRERAATAPNSSFDTMAGWAGSSDQARRPVPDLGASAVQSSSHRSSAPRAFG